MNSVLQSWDRACAGSRVLRFVDVNLRGVGQVMFQDNPLSGALFLAAIAWGSFAAGVPQVLFGGLLAVVAATLTAQWLRVDAAGLGAGLYGYNAYLVGLALGAVGTYLLGFPGSDAALAAAALLYGAGIGGAAFPVLMALTVDRCAPDERAAAVATFQTAYDLAIALGATLLGPVYARFGFRTMNAVAACAVGLSVVVLLLARGNPRRAPDGRDGDWGRGTGD